jgi:hypothetical protein
MKRILLVAALLLASFLSAVVPAAADDADDPPTGALIACGRGGTVTPPNCMTLPQAIVAARQIMGTVTIDMMPGEYCPVIMPDLGGQNGVYWSRLDFVGVGLAAYGASGPPGGLTGEEAELTSFQWDNSCGTAPSALMSLQNPGGSTSVRFINLSFIGSNVGPTSGLIDDGVPLTVDDVIVEHLDTGLQFTSNPNIQSAAVINNSAFVNNFTGVFFDGGNGSIDDATLANNTYGFYGTGFGVSLEGDTLAHNTNGFYAASSGSVQAVNTINANNSADCAGNAPSAWENQFSENNLVGTTCPHGSDGDLVWDNTTFPNLAANGGPTMSILPTNQAVGHAVTSVCGSISGTDQREYRVSSTSCDIGAIQTAGTGNSVAGSTPPNNTTLDFGTVPMGQTGRQSVAVFRSSGGDLMYLYGASISGTDFKISGDGCKYDPMSISPGAPTCYVSISVPANDDQSTLTGTLTINTSGGNLSFPLTSTNVPALLPPSNVTATAGNKKVTLNWTAPSNGGPTVDGYEIQESTDGGSTWNYVDQVDAAPTSDTITHLVNGTTYEFEVQSQAGSYVSDWSDPSSAVTPIAPPDASALTAPGNAAVRYGDTVNFATKLTDTVTGNPIKNAAVDLLSRHGTSGSFGKVGAGTTNAQGKVTVSVKPKANGQYEWHYAGAAGHNAVNSPIATVHVAQVVTARLVKASVKKGSAATVWGTVRPPENGQQVKLQMKSSGHWVTEKAATIHKQKLPNGSTAQGFVVSLTLHNKGTFVLRVTRAATGANTAGSSKPLTLHVT